MFASGGLTVVNSVLLVFFTAVNSVLLFLSLSNSQFVSLTTVKIEHCIGFREARGGVGPVIRNLLACVTKNTGVKFR